MRSGAHPLGAQNEDLHSSSLSGRHLSALDSGQYIARQCLIPRKLVRSSLTMLSPNPTSRIVPKNPLADESCDTLLRKVEQFAEEKGLINVVDTLKKGAIRECSLPNVVYNYD